MEGEAAPPTDAPPAPTPNTPEPAPVRPRDPGFQWDQRAGIGAAAAAFASGLLPWRASEAWFSLPAWMPNALVFLPAMAALILWLGVRDRITSTTRLVIGIAGQIVVAAGLYGVLLAAGDHAAARPELGLVGHLFHVGVGAYLATVAGLLLMWGALPTRATPATPAPAPDPRPRALLRWGMPLLIFLAAFSLYNTDLEKPSIIDFDEAHYVRVAQNMTDGVLIDPAWGEPRPFNFEHPPVGKYLVALGYKLYGEPHDELNWPQLQEFCSTDKPACARDAQSWRQMSALVGALGALGIYWLGARLFRNVAAGVASAAFLLFDNLYYLHSRLAMLDIFPSALALLALGVYLGPRPAHRWIGSAIFGLAVAAKHPALFLAPPFLLLAYLRSPRDHRWMKLRDALLHVLILPGAVYFASYAPYLWIWAQAHGPKYAIEMFTYVHQESFRWTYRAHPEKPHPYISRPWTWITMRRPVFYFVGYSTGGNVGHIYSVGNPFVWWTGIVAILYAWFYHIPRFLRTTRWSLRSFWDWLARPFAFTPANNALLATTLFAASYGAFFLLKRDPFMFYFVQASPYLSLALGGVAGAMWLRGPGGRLGAIAMLVMAGAVFAFYHPLSAGSYITEADFRYIMSRLSIPH